MCVRQIPLGIDVLTDQVRDAIRKAERAQIVGADPVVMRNAELAHLRQRGIVGAQVPDVVQECRANDFVVVAGGAREIGGLRSVLQLRHRFADVGAAALARV